MADAFPWPLKATLLAPTQNITFGRDLAGLGLSGRSAEPYWAGTLTTPALIAADRKKALSDLIYWADMNKRLSFVHPLYLYPDGFGPATWPLVDDPVVTAITARRTVVVSGLDIGMVLPRGTRFTFKQDDLRCYRALPVDVTVASSTAQSLPVSMRLPLGVFAEGCTTSFVSPEVRLAIVPGSWQPDEEIDFLPLSFDVSETLV